MNINQEYMKQLQELQRRYINKIEKEIKDVVQKTKPSQFDDRYMDPKVQVLMHSYQNELDVLHEKMMQKILEEKHKYKQMACDLKTVIYESQESNQEIEEFYDEHNYPYTAFRLTDSDLIEVNESASNDIVSENESYSASPTVEE